MEPMSLWSSVCVIMTCACASPFTPLMMPLQLEAELLKAEALFEEAKKNAMHDIENMDAVRASDFGAAHASGIDKVTAEAAKVMALRGQIQAFQMCRTGHC
mgnify:CR=1 FL=1